MEYFPGGSLDQRIDKKGLPFYEVIKYSNQIGNAIAFMHENKMLHLDIKPGNVVLDKDQNAILIDFGLSKQYDENGQPESSTTVGGGTPGYAPLEQANYHDDHNFPVTMDVYALDATIYKMFVGERAPVASEILNDGFPTQILSAKCSSKKMIACVEKAMAPLKNERYQSVNELLIAIESCAETITNKNTLEETISCEVPVLNDCGDWGFSYYYDENKKLFRRRVISHIPFPDTIKITKDDSYTGRKYSILLHKSEIIQGYVSVVVMGECKQKEISGGIPDDVIRYLKEKGFFSPIHWEDSMEEQTHIPIEVRVVFEYKGGGSFSRSANDPGIGTLHRAVEGLLFNTSLGNIFPTLRRKKILNQTT